MLRLAKTHKRRLKLVALFTFLGLFIGIGLRSAHKSLGDTPIKMDVNFDVVKARKDFRPPAFQSWPDSEEQDVSENCALFWKQLLKTSAAQLQSPRSNFVLEPRIYKQSKWMIQAKKKLRRILHDQGSRMNDDHVDDLRADFYRESLLVSKLEEHFVHHIRNVRLFGRCVSTAPLSKFQGKKAKAAIQLLLPWLKITGGILDKLFMTKHEGKGILIPLLDSSRVSTQVDRVGRLVRVLQMQGNRLPIQIAYSSKRALSREQQSFLKGVAESEKSEYVLGKNKERGTVYEKQVLLFLDVDQYIKEGTPVSDNLVYAVAVLFSHFDNTVVLLPHTIPMTDNLALLFENKEFQSQGMLFFKDRPLLDSKPNPFPPGFFEANELVNKHAAVSSLEASLFGLKQPIKRHTSRVTELGFQRLLDPSMALFNAQKAMTGLLISSILPLHSVIGPKYDVSARFNPELLWLGQELAGSSDYVHFNRFYASAPGVLTPLANRPVESHSKELCSSSWSQVSGDDERLLYITSHQLENRKIPQFSVAVRTKLTTLGTNDLGNAKNDDSLAQETVGKNILYIKDVLQPMPIESPLINKEGQPFLPTKHVDGFGSVDDFWCSYDVVGSVAQGNRGLVYEYEKPEVNRFLSYVNVWLQDPKPGFIY